MPVARRTAFRSSPGWHYPGPVTRQPGLGPARRADVERNRARVLQIAREQLAAGDDSLQLNTIARLAGVAGADTCCDGCDLLCG